MKKMQSYIFEIHFWETLEKEIMKRYPDLKPQVNSPKRFSIENIKAKTVGRQYGLIFEKLKVLVVHEQSKTPIMKIIRDKSIVETASGEFVISEESFPIAFINFKSRKVAERMAIGLSDLICNFTEEFKNQCF